MKIEAGANLSNGIDFQRHELREVISGEVVVSYQHDSAFPVEKRAEALFFYERDSGQGGLERGNGPQFPA